MKELFRGNEKGIMLLINDQVKKLEDNNIVEIKQNHLTKVLLSHIKTYQTLLTILLEKDERNNK